MSEEKTINNDLAAVIHATEFYYNELIARGIPEALAIRIVGDWYHAVVQTAVHYFSNRGISARDALTRRMAREIGQ